MILRQIDVQVVQQFGEGDYQKEGLSMKDQEVKPAPVIHVARRTARLGNNMSRSAVKGMPMQVGDGHNTSNFLGHSGHAGKQGTQAGQAHVRGFRKCCMAYVVCCMPYVVCDLLNSLHRWAYRCTRNGGVTRTDPLWFFVAIRRRRAVGARTGICSEIPSRPRFPQKTGRRRRNPTSSVWDLDDR
jgi:hypothetical protein